jgi:hypothetical protein
VLTSIAQASAKITWENPRAIIAGGSGQTMKLQLINPVSQEILPISTQALITIDPSLGSIEPQMVSVQQGISQGIVRFTPKTIAQQQVKLQVSVPGITTATGHIISIFPADPIQASIDVNQNNIPTSGTKILAKVRLMDQYGNTTWNRSGDSVTISLPGRSAQILAITSKDSTTTTQS